MENNKISIVNTIEEGVMSCLQEKLKDNRVLGVLLIGVGVILCLSDNKKEEVKQWHYMK